MWVPAADLTSLVLELCHRAVLKKQRYLRMTAIAPGRATFQQRHFAASVATLIHPPQQSQIGPHISAMRALRQSGGRKNRRMLPDFCMCRTCSAAIWIRLLRCRHRDRMAQMNPGGRKLARSKPTECRYWSHWQSETSVFRPGTFFTCCALTR